MKAYPINSIPRNDIITIRYKTYIIIDILVYNKDMLIRITIMVVRD